MPLAGFPRTVSWMLMHLMTWSQGIMGSSDGESTKAATPLP
jgi:hypothetical protein